MGTDTDAPRTAADSGVEASSLPDRRARLAALKDRRPAAGADTGEPRARRASLPLAQRTQATLEGKDGAQQFRKQMVMRVHKMLTRTPDDGSGMVPDTPFTKAGVTNLMMTLRERAANQGAPGAKVAANALTFLAPSEESEEAVAGASVAKLQTVARMASRFSGGAL